MPIPSRIQVTSLRTTSPLRFIHSGLYGGEVISVRALTRPLRRVAHLFIMATKAVITHLPRRWVPIIGGLFGRTLGRLVWPLNSGIEARIAYLEQPPTVDEIWADLGARAMEFIDASRQLDRVVIPESTLRIFKDVSRGDQGVLVATLHLGHWELMAAKLSQVGHPFQAIAARSQSGPVYDALDTHRRTLGVHT